MAEENKSISSSYRRTRMISLLRLFVDTHAMRKMLELAHGIEYIHSEGIVHGDIRGVIFLIAHVVLFTSFSG